MGLNDPLPPAELDVLGERLVIARSLGEVFEVSVGSKTRRHRTKRT